MSESPRGSTLLPKTVQSLDTTYQFRTLSILIKLWSQMRVEVLAVNSSGRGCWEIDTGRQLLPRANPQLSAAVARAVAQEMLTVAPRNRQPDACALQTQVSTFTACLKLQQTDWIPNKKTSSSLTTRATGAGRARATYNPVRLNQASH